MSVALTTPRSVRSAPVTADRRYRSLLVLLAPLRGDDDLFEAPLLAPAAGRSRFAETRRQPRRRRPPESLWSERCNGRVDASSWFFSLTRGESSDGLQQSPVDGDGLP